MTYFVAFQAECESRVMNDVVDTIEVKSIVDISYIEVQLAYKWFGDDRKVTILNIVKL